LLGFPPSLAYFFQTEFQRENNKSKNCKSKKSNIKKIFFSSFSSLFSFSLKMSQSSSISSSITERIDISQDGVDNKKVTEYRKYFLQTWFFFLNYVKSFLTLHSFLKFVLLQYRK
jgi:hypothetical protein